MRLAVIQHARRDTAIQGCATLLEAVVNACSRGASVVVLPQPVWLTAADLASVASAAFLAEEYPGVTIVAPPLASVPRSDPSFGDVAGDAPSAHGARMGRTPLGSTAQLGGDDCLDPLITAELTAAAPDAIIMRPGSESELQAEAMVERALALSESVSGLVIVAEGDGNVGGAAGHGGSAIAMHGELIGEAMAGDDVIEAELEPPVTRPDARPPMSELPPILAQRWALHHGARMKVEYPADLS